MNNRLYILIMSTLLFACEPKSVDETVTSAVQENERVLVKVNGEVISENDLDAAIVRTLGEYGAFQLDDAGRNKVLQSLVVSKAMAITQQNKLNEEELKRIEQMVKAYREELLVKRYLKNNVVPIPVTSQMVEDYYKKHPEQFGGKTIRTFEVVKGLTKAEGPARKKIISAITELSIQSEWKEAVSELKLKGLQIDYSKGALSKGTLKSDIDSIISDTPLGKTSNIHFVDGLPLITRILSEKTIAPKPLSLVSNDIKKSLAPIQLKKAVKQASDELLLQVSVTYSETE